MRLVGTSWPRPKYFLVRPNQTKPNSVNPYYIIWLLRVTNFEQFCFNLDWTRQISTNGQPMKRFYPVITFSFIILSQNKRVIKTPQKTWIKNKFYSKLKFPNGCFCLPTPAYEATPHLSITYVSSVDFQMEIKIICHCSFRSQTTQILLRVSLMFCRRWPKSENTRAELLFRPLDLLFWRVRYLRCCGLLTPLLTPRQP